MNSEKENEDKRSAVNTSRDPRSTSNHCNPCNQWTDKGTEDRRSVILAAAEKVFDHNGYAATKMEAIATEAKVSKGSLYNYFKSKRELFTQLFPQTLATQQVQAEQIMNSELSATGKIEQLLDDWFSRLGRYKRIGGLVLEFWATAARQEREGELAIAFRKIYDYWDEHISRIIAKGIDDGEFREDIDPHIAAALIVALADGVTHQAILHIGAESDVQFLAALKRSIIFGLTGGKNETHSQL